MTRALVPLMGDADWPTARFANRRMGRVASSKQGPGKARHKPKRADRGGSRSRGRAYRRRVSLAIRLAAQTGASRLGLATTAGSGDRQHAVAAVLAWPEMNAGTARNHSIW